MTTPSFDLPSAKNLSVKRAADQFVATDMYWRVLESDSHNVIFGTRGSGKTMLLRMMSVQHLAEFRHRDPRATEALVQKSRYGIFLPFGIDWCVAFRDASSGGQRFFQDGVNLVAAEALVDVLATILREGFQSLENPDECERNLCLRLSEAWCRPLPTRIVSFSSLRNLLWTQQAILRDLWRSGDAPSKDDENQAGLVFRGTSLFFPIVQGVKIANELFGLSAEHKWLMCLDELEGLSSEQVRTIATVLRGDSSVLVFKITTQPYTFDGASTDFSESASAVDFRDYEIKRLQYDPADPEYRNLVGGILRNRLERVSPSHSALSPTAIFGASTFAERAERGEAGFAATKKALVSGKNVDSARKRIPAAAIRSLRKQAQGHTNSEAYSGWDTIVRITDGNPGMFVRLMNELGIGERFPVAASLQHRTVMELAKTWHEWSQALYEDGRRLYTIIDDIGNEISQRLHSNRVRDDEVQDETSRFKIDLRALPSADAEALKVGARHGLLVAEAATASLRYPIGEGVWRLSYALTPKFWLLPRRGRVGIGMARQLLLQSSGTETDDSTYLTSEGEPDDV